MIESEGNLSGEISAQDFSKLRENLILAITQDFGGRVLTMDQRQQAIQNRLDRNDIRSEIYPYQTLFEIV